jgi:hypothetical protein
MQITARKLIVGMIVGAAVGVIGEASNWFELRITTPVSPLRDLVVVGAIGGAIVGALFVLLEPLRERNRRGFWLSWVIIGHLLTAIVFVPLIFDWKPFEGFILWMLFAWGTGLGLGIAHRQLQGARYRDPI